MKRNLSHLELFAGIGGFRKAIDIFCNDNNIKSKCVAYSENDKYANITYKANYKTDNEIEIDDINNFTSITDNIRKLPNFKLLTGGFPCQAFSMMGKKLGLKEKRGNIFYTIIKILQIKKPDHFILENVRNLKNHDKGRTYNEIMRSLQEDAGYKVHNLILITSNFGLPQTRRRIFFIGYKTKSHTNNINFTENDVISEFKKLKKTGLKFYKNVLDGILEKNANKKYYLSEKIKPTILADGSKNYKSSSKINRLIARTLTATMVKMHRANQDNYYSDDFFEKNYSEENFEKIPKEELSKKNIRKLTPLEALKLQGFDRNFYLKALKSGVSNHQLYKQSGNAVSVNTVYGLLNYLYKNKIFLL